MINSYTRLGINTIMILLIWLVLMFVFGVKSDNKLYIFANTFPLYFIYYLGCKAVFIIGYELFILNDCDEAYEEVMRQVDQAKQDLNAKEFNFEAGLKRIVIH